MTSSERGVEEMKGLLKYSWQPDLKSPYMVVGWSVDASRLGIRVVDYLNRKLGGQGFAEIDQVGFFSLDGVAIEDNVVQFPENKFYACPNNDLIVFISPPPIYEWHRFFNLILDAAENFSVKELYAIGGMVSLGPHSVPRDMVCTFNSSELKESLSSYNLAGGMDYETPPGQRPTLNSFLLWEAKRRNIQGVTIWVPVPFYLIGIDDPKAQKRILELFDQRFNLKLDFTEIDQEIGWQNQRIAEVRNTFPDVDEAIGKLERNVALSAEETQRLAEEIEKYLTAKNG